MGRDKNFINHRGRVLVNAEWVEGGCGIGVEQRGPQRIIVHDPTQPLTAIIFAIAKPAFPLPSLKVIAELTQITFEAAGKLIIVGGNLVGTQPRFQTSVTHAGSESGTLNVRMFWVKSSRRRIIRDCEWIERILNRHANAFATYSECMSCIREYVPIWSRRQGPVPETAHVLEITKKLQVLLINFAVERPIEVFTVHRGHCRCESEEVKELLPPRKTKPRHILRIAFYIWKGVRRRGPCPAIKLWLVNKISDTPGKIARPIINTTKTSKVSVGGNVAVAAEDGSAIVPLCVNNNVRLVITGTSEHVSYLFSLIVGSAEIV